jgi:hypothetical protein
MKLAFPTGMTGSYAFAGHIVMLDTEGPLERSLMLASADDMNVWHSQLGFAFGSGFNVTMIAQHMLEYYHIGILRSLAHVQVRREVTFSAPSRTTSRLLDTDAPHDLSLQMIDEFSKSTDIICRTSSQAFPRKGNAEDKIPRQQSLNVDPGVLPSHVQGQNFLKCAVQLGLWAGQCR